MYKLTLDQPARSVEIGDGTVPSVIGVMGHLAHSSPCCARGPRAKILYVMIAIPNAEKSAKWIHDYVECRPI